MSGWTVEKKPCSYGWATQGWAWKEYLKYAWAGNLMRSTKDYFDLWLNRDAYIEKYIPADEIARRNDEWNAK